MRTQSMQNHKLRLEEIRNENREKFKNTEHKIMRKQLKKNKQAHEKIDKIFDHTRADNAALVSHIHNIRMRKSEHSESMKLLRNYNSTK